MFCKHFIKHSRLFRLAAASFLYVVVSSAAVAGAFDISFRLDEPGQVSVGLYSNRGKLLRQLARGVKMESGEHYLSWDGLDRYGTPAPPGEYEWRLLQTPGFTREFLVNVGTNQTFDSWPGNHGGPTVLATDAEHNLYVGATSSEGEPHILKMSMDGRRKFWGNGVTLADDGLVSMAVVGDTLYGLFSDGTVDLVNAATGADMVPLKIVGNFKLRLHDLIHSLDPEAEKKPIDRRGVSPMVLSGGSDVLVVTYENQNEVRLLRPNPTSIPLLKSIQVARPGGSCVAPDGRIFVISGTTIVSLDRETGVTKQVVNDPELFAPTHVCYDPVNDDLLVIQHNDQFDQVKRYHVSDGKWVATYGRARGRMCGEFNPLDFGNLLDIVADGKGGFFTVEGFPRRVAHFRGRDRHELVAQWFGGMRWASLISLDPIEPTIAYCALDQDHLAKCRIDYENHTWSPTKLYELPDSFSRAGLGRSEPRRPMFPNFGQLSYWEVRHVGDATFLVNNGRMQGSVAALARIDDQQNRIVPVAFVGGLHSSRGKTAPPSRWSEAMQAAGYDPLKAPYSHFGFSWSDANSNGKIDPEEVQLASRGLTWREAHCFIDPGWNVYYPLDGNLRNRSPWLVIRNEGKPDLPIWNWNHCEPASARFPDTELTLGAASPVGIYHDADGNTYTVGNAAPDSNRPDVPPLSWPNNTTNASRFQKWNPTGELEWSVGLHTAARNRPPGQFAQVRGILGMVNDCFLLVDAREPASVWTRDGLYAGSFYSGPAPRASPTMPRNQVYLDDNHWGLVLQTRQGDVLWGGMSDNSTPVYRISGWQNWKRQNGKLTIKQSGTGARWKGNGLRGEYFTASDFSGKPALERTDRQIWFGPLWGDYRKLPAPTLPDGKLDSLAIIPGTSARWTGFFEAPLGEAFTFTVYTYGHSELSQTVGSRVRLSVNGKVVIDEWDHVTLQKIAGGETPTRGCSSPPILLRPGQFVPLRLDYAAAGGDQAHLHLFIESDSIDLRHVPQRLLYPVVPNDER